MNFRNDGRRTFLKQAAVGATLAGLGSLAAISGANAASRMDAGEPSETALGAARHRAVHQLLDFPRVLDDPWAVRMLGVRGEGDLLASIQQYNQPSSRIERAGIVVRSRYADDCFDAALGRGVLQYVVLGAGLDTFAYRNRYQIGTFRTFEVDHPATQAWKRARLQEMGMAAPASLTFAPVDFERESLADGLVRAGFRRDEPAFFSWLGVVIYLSEAAVMDTLRYISTLAPGSEVVFDFALPWSALDAQSRRSRQASAARVASVGEPWITFFQPWTLVERLQALGYSQTTLLAPQDANRRYFHGRSDGMRVSVSQLMAARV